MNKFFHLIIKSISQNWLTIGVVFISLAITLFLWQSFRNQEGKYLQNTVNIEAESLKNGVELEMRERLLALQRMADRWAIQPNGTSHAAWNMDAQNYYEDFKGFQAVEWADETYYIRWIIPLKGNESAVNIDLTNQPGWREIFDKAREDGQAVILHKPQLAQGGRGVNLYCPIGQGENFKGFIVGVFRVEKLFETMINPEIVSKYDIQIFKENEIIYKSGEFADLFDVKAIQTISFTNDEWQIEISPKTQQIAALSNQTDEKSLIAGLVFSLLLGLSVYFARRARRKTTNLRIEIAARQQTQIALEKSEHLYRQLTEKSQGLICTHDLE